ncbi:CPCC family cysteine-rich protein [Clostridium sp.]|uniref:CPCC family cysteine-rich protein n=1 Tax=Clostridium sp. TaxID=1506 RepID=UPI0028529583|nr:CPCC family cysteine-rich protein [Clostridium sp.]
MKYKCLCCGYMTLETSAEFDICHVCFWEDDVYIIMDEKSKLITSLYNEAGCYRRHIISYKIRR